METICFKIPAEKKPFRTDLPFSGRDAEGNVYTADGRSLLKNGRRFLPVMGEFHFSRFEPRFWREEILKMKAGGVTIIATYMFWIHHEERQGGWDFSGCRNIRAFSEICGECGMELWLRVGPWAHGECRNGGFPDWIEGDSSFEKRVNDPKYLELVKIWFEKISHEVQGLFVKDGGPILGLQLENEYGHCGGPEDKTLQEAHFRTLYRLARETGFIVPYYTATAWGGACTIDETMRKPARTLCGKTDPFPMKMTGLRDVPGKEGGTKARMIFADQSDILAGIVSFLIAGTGISVI